VVVQQGRRQSSVRSGSKRGGAECRPSRHSDSPSISVSLLEASRAGSRSTTRGLNDRSGGERRRKGAAHGRRTDSRQLLRPFRARAARGTDLSPRSFLPLKIAWPAPFPGLSCFCSSSGWPRWSIILIRPPAPLPESAPADRISPPRGPCPISRRCRTAASGRLLRRTPRRRPNLIRAARTSGAGARGAEGLCR